MSFKADLVSVLLCLAWLSQFSANALPLLDQLSKRQIVTRMHTASTTNVVTDFYSTTTQVEVAPTVEFIISGDTTITTTLPQADGSTPTGVPTTTILLTANLQNNNAAGPTSASSSDCATTVANGTPKGTVYVSPVQNSNVNPPSSSPQATFSTSSLVASASVLPSSSSPFSSPSSANTAGSEVPSAHVPAPPASTTSGFSVTSLQPAYTSSTPVSSAATTEEATSSTEAEQATSTSQQAPNTITSQAASTSTPQTSTSSTSQSTSANALGGVPTALVYSPYNNDNSCKDSSSVYNDLQYIKSKGVSQIRVYGTDCNSLQTITSAAKSFGITINQGLWISSAGVDSIDDSVNDILSYGQANGWDLFDILTIGNEAVLSGYCTVEDLINKISSVRSKFESAGFTGKYTTSEPPVTFQNNPDLCRKSNIDFVGINSHAYFDVNSSADTAGSFVKGQLELIQQICGTNNVEVTETGYPSAGDQNGGNIPSEENQAIAVQKILSEMDMQVTILSTFDDLWKQPGPYNIEQHFGISKLLGA
ncbi:LAFA_0D11078g1_1 [Lachancea sp. 'fantastica']|nr:LAFA_0D11078g1_1 [Lachancea sp. 'fantastica']